MEKELFEEERRIFPTDPVFITLQALFIEESSGYSEYN